MSQEHKDVTSVWQVVKFTLFSISAGLIQVDRNHFVLLGI